MLKLIIKKKGRFFINSPYFKVFDYRKILFYSNNFVNNFKGIFYLPAGEYYITHKLKRLRYKNQSFKKLPKKERNLKHNWSNFKILFDDNPNKATIYHKKKEIVFDNAFKTVPLFQLVFILAHEVGHKYYKSEFGADAFAVNTLLKLGYNRSQIGFAPLMTLSNKQIERKKAIIENLKSPYR